MYRSKLFVGRYCRGARHAVGRFPSRRNGGRIFDLPNLSGRFRQPRNHFHYRWRYDVFRRLRGLLTYRQFRGAAGYKPLTVMCRCTGAEPSFPSQFGDAHHSLPVAGMDSSATSDLYRFNPILANAPAVTTVCRYQTIGNLSGSNSLFDAGS